MAAHRSANTATCGARLARITIMCASTSRMASHARAAAHLSSGSLSGSAAPIIARAARSLPGCKKGLGAAQRAAGEVGESDIDGGRNIHRLLPLQLKREHDITTVIAGWMLIQGLVAALEMHNGGGCRASHARDIVGKASEDSDGVVGAGGIIG